jgi:hypothetical protein
MKWIDKNTSGLKAIPTFLNIPDKNIMKSFIKLDTIIYNGEVFAEQNFILARYGNIKRIQYLQYYWKDIFILAYNLGFNNTFVDYVMTNLNTNQFIHKQVRYRFELPISRYTYDYHLRIFDYFEAIDVIGFYINPNWDPTEFDPYPSSNLTNTEMILNLRFKYKPKRIYIYTTETVLPQFYYQKIFKLRYVKV